MFQVHDTILYGSRGIYTITEIADRSFRGVTKPYYVLTSDKQSSSIIYVPLDKPELLQKTSRCR